MMMHITERKDGRFMGRFVIGQKKGGKRFISMFMEKLMKRHYKKFKLEWKSNRNIDIENI